MLLLSSELYIYYVMCLKIYLLIWKRCFILFGIFINYFVPLLNFCRSSDDGTCRIWDARGAQFAPRIYLPRPPSPDGDSSTVLAYWLLLWFTESCWTDYGNILQERTMSLLLVMLSRVTKSFAAHSMPMDLYLSLAALTLLLEYTRYWYMFSLLYLDLSLNWPIHSYILPNFIGMT